jgi:hypothetical protein
MKRSDLVKRLNDAKKLRDELNADAAHWNSEGGGRELDELIDSIEGRLNSGRSPA